MVADAFLSPILDSDALTRGLSDPEARILVEWLVDETERRAAAGRDAAAWVEAQRLYRRARAVGRFVGLWCYARLRGAAGQLAAAERFYWPMPDGDIDPCELMEAILRWESENAYLDRRAA